MSASSEPRSANARANDARSTPHRSDTATAATASASVPSVTAVTRAGVARAAFEIDIAHATYHALMRSLLVALQMMTRVPVRLAEAPTARDHGWAAAWFPLVGAGVGAVAAGAYWAAWRM